MLRKIFICTLALICVGQATADDRVEWYNDDPDHTVSFYVYTNHDRTGGQWIYNVRKGESRHSNGWIGNDAFVEVYNEIRTSNFNGRMPINGLVDIKKSTFRPVSPSGDACQGELGTQAAFVWTGKSVNQLWYHKNIKDVNC
ncbi:MAG TPA: hypothetical protein VLG71_01035 [Candidatus Limnocylindria bacterium]|nr:hypothetical protein [Candidatus Limnocylindria bacterium]